MSKTNAVQFSHIEAAGPTDREIHAPKFAITATSKGWVITHDGKRFMTIMAIGRLPRGFQQRMVDHFMGELTGRRTALWSEQAIYGEAQRDPAMSRRRGEVQAEAYAATREGRAPDFTPAPPPAEPVKRVICHGLNCDGIGGPICENTAAMSVLPNDCMCYVNRHGLT